MQRDFKNSGKSVVAKNAKDGNYAKDAKIPKTSM